jgi:hypothetical protein
MVEAGDVCSAVQTPDFGGNEQCWGRAVVNDLTETVVDGDALMPGRPAARP